MKINNIDLNGLAGRAATELVPLFRKMGDTAEYNTNKVLEAFSRRRVSDSLFSGTTGYGYDDRGREVLDLVYADVFRTEDALVRIGFVSGTHAIACALFGLLRPGDKLISAMGAPYDTLQGVIGMNGRSGSLADFGIGYGQAETADGRPDLDAIIREVSGKNVKAVLIQRSRGYSDRAALSVSQIEEICAAVRGVNNDIKIIVDNCYGEFTEKSEPACADIMAGSLIKNPGGGLAPTGGYVAGGKELVEAAAQRLTAPGIGRECGATLGMNRHLYQGLFMAPHTVTEALKTAAFCAHVMEQLGFKTSPKWDEPRYDLIQAISFGAPEPLLRFCGGIQAGAPVDSFAAPEPWDMPGYDCPVVMAAGAFIQGASIELSCDAPMREPYTAYLQGGLTFESGKAGVLKAVHAILKSGESV